MIERKILLLFYKKYFIKKLCFLFLCRNEIWSRGGVGFGFGVGFDSRVGAGFGSAWSGLLFCLRDWFLVPAVGWAYNLEWFWFFGFDSIAVGL